MEPVSRLPYFDLLLEQFAANTPEFAETFGRHVHWALFDDPEHAGDSPADYVEGAERLTRRICEAAGCGDGMDILDVGCGFGGTVASLNERLSNVRLTGLNIDERQLLRAREQVKARPGNSVTFVEGDACQLPFEDRSFDIVLAVECIFHFPSRRKFFREVKRVLRPGGRHALSDFVVTVPVPLTDETLALRARVTRTCGPGTPETLYAYDVLARESGLGKPEVQDITEGLIPGYAIAARLLGSVSEEAGWATRMVEDQARSGLVRYVIMAFSND